MPRSLIRWLLPWASICSAGNMRDQNFVLTTLSGQEVRVPKLMYGSAWKKERTAEFAIQAFEQGFIAVDTANQPKHYNESGVGEALRTYQQLVDSTLEIYQRRDSRAPHIFVQTKFTPADGQDPERMPYDASHKLADQVNASFHGSLKNLGLAWGEIDSLVLHSPLNRHEQTLEVWRAMEDIYKAGGVSFLGVSNFDLGRLDRLLQDAIIRPQFLQIRVHAKDQWSRPIRSYCNKRGIILQGFSLTTGNRHVLSDPKTLAIAGRHGKTPEEVILRLGMQLGMLVLTGPRERTHVDSDMRLGEWTLSDDEVSELESWSSAFDASFKVAVTFRSEASFPVKVFWEESMHGKRVLQGRLESYGHDLHINTFHGHGFIVMRDDGGEEILKRWRSDGANGPEQIVVVDMKVKLQFRLVSSTGGEEAELYWLGQNNEMIHQGTVPLELDSFHGHRFQAMSHQRPGTVWEWVADAGHGDEQIVNITFGSNEL